MKHCLVIYAYLTYYVIYVIFVIIGIAVKSLHIFVHVPSQELDFQPHIPWSFLEFNEFT